MATLQSLADAPGNQREYETIYILAPETMSDGIATVNDRVKNVIETMGGRVLNIDNWGKRRLAYNIKKQARGIYLYWQYLGTSGLVDELERNLRMIDTCIRYMTVKVTDDVDPNARPSELDDEAYARAATPAVDEEELEAADDAEEASASDDKASDEKASASDDKASDEKADDGKADDDKPSDDDKNRSDSE